MEIKLVFDKMITSLAGNRFGRETFKEQVKEKLDLAGQNFISIPTEIEDIASSFIQGFYSEISEQVGREKALFNMVLKSENEYVMEKIRECIETYGV